MKNKLFLLLLLAFAAQWTMEAADFDIKWGKKENFTNKKDGYITNFIAKKGNYLYAYYSSGGVGQSYTPDNHAKLIVFDSQTLEKLYIRPIKGYKENRATKELSKLSYYKTVVADSVVYVFWMGQEKRAKQLYLSSYDAKLNPIAPLKKIFESAGQKGDDISPEILILSNNSGHILIGSEKGTKENVNLKFIYKVVDAKLNFIVSKEVELPINFDLKWWESKSGLSSNYELLDDDNLFITSTLVVDEKSQKKNEPSRYTMLSIVPIMTGEVKVYPFRFTGKDTYNLKYKTDKKTIGVFGIFSALNPDIKGETQEGIFSCSIDCKTLSLVQGAEFAPFTGAQREMLSPRKNEKFNSYLCQIVNIQKYDNNTILFCTKQNRYSLVSQYGPGTDYCENSNVYCFSISEKGNLNWVSFCDRILTYTQINFSSFYHYSVNDIKVVRKDDKFLVIYDSSTYLDKKDRRKSKSSDELRNYEDYLVLDPVKGSFQQKQIIVNTPTTKKSELRHLVAGNTFLVDDQLYLYEKRVKMKTFYACTGWIMLSIPYVLESCRMGKGYIGKIDLIK